MQSFTVTFNHTVGNLVLPIRVTLNAPDPDTARVNACRKLLDELDFSAASAWPRKQ